MNLPVLTGSTSVIYEKIEDEEILQSDTSYSNISDKNKIK